MNRDYRPRVTIQIPPPRHHHDDSLQQQPSPYPPSITIPVTASTIPNQADANPFLQALYAQKASEFMFKQFEGINRFTKSGLSVGEKSVVWLYTKFSKWSRKWFTHCFLFIVVTIYSAVGAALFQAIEGT